MNTQKWFRLLAIVGMLLTSAIAYTPASAQDGDGFPLGASSAYCDPGYLGPFVGCTPWEGLTVSFTSADGAFSATCTTAGTDRAAGCGVDVPFGSTIIASIDPAVIPAGYILEGPATQEFIIPDGPPDGIFGGPVFVLLPAEAPVEPETPVEPEVPVEETSFPLGAASAFCEPGYLGPFEGCTPWEGLTVNFVSADGSFSASCVTAGTDRAAGCGVDVPFGSTIIASIDPTAVPIDYMLEGTYEQVFEIPAGPPEGQFGGPVFVLLPYEGGGEDTHEPPAEDPVEIPAEVEPVNDSSPALKLPNTGAGSATAERATAWMAIAVILTIVSGTGGAIIRRMR